MLDLAIVKGAGDLATGVAYRLVRAGSPVIMTELPQPTVVRRSVAFAQAVFDGCVVVEGISARLASGPDDALRIARGGEVAVLVDPGAACVADLRPDVVVDAIMAKRNTGTRRGDAPLVIALGPGFVAGRDAHAVIETNRGRRLGRVILEGEAEPDTGVPAVVDGHGADRVLRASGDGPFMGLRRIGDMVTAGEAVATVGSKPIVAPFDGCLRGIIQTGVPVRVGMKVGDVDPRASRERCFTISDKALAIGGGVLEAVLTLRPLRPPLALARA